MKRMLPLCVLVCCTALGASAQTTFTAGNLVVLQTSNTLSKASSQVTLKEFSTTGAAGLSVTIPMTGTNPFQSSGVFGGSEGFLSTSTDGKYLLLAGYETPASFSDITATSGSAVTRVIGTVAPSGFYLRTDTSTLFFSVNDIRGAISDGTNRWASGASNASIDGIDYFGPGTQAALGGGSSPAKAYGLRIFNGQIYYSTQKAGPSNSASQLGIFALGSGLPISGSVATTQLINTGTVIPEDFSINPTSDVCYIAVNLNTAAGGIQKWTRSGTTWSLAYTLGTGVANTGAYGLVADYSGSTPVIYATTFDAAGNRVIKVVDNGSAASATITTLVAASSNVFYKGITFAPVASGTPVANLTISTDTASEAAQSIIVVKANLSFPAATAQTVNLNVSGTGITSGDYILKTSGITIPAGATSASDTFTVVDDILVEGTETARIAMRSTSSGITLGIDTVKNITITDNDAPGPPSISINTASTTDLIDGGSPTTLVSPYIVSGVISDPSDPASTFGIVFNVSTTQASGVLSLTSKSSNTAVVPDAQVVISGTGNIRTAKITPTGIGYSSISLKLKDGFDSSTFVISYAASAASGTPANTYWHTGMSDASDAIALDSDYYVTGDDELNVLNVYRRKQSGLPVLSYNYSSNLALPDPAKPEADIEAATCSFVNPGRAYWASSMSNGKAPFDNKPNRDRIFATTISGTGAATTFVFSGWAALKSSLLSWGDANGYGFTASAAAGVDSKASDGYALEGMVFGPDSTTLYMGFRAPLVPTATRTKAVIAPIRNFETWFNNGTPSGNPVIGNPIELDLGGRGIRDLARLSNGTYIILAGDPGEAQKGAVYKWSGKAGDLPVRMPSPAVDTLNIEGIMQADMPGQPAITQLQLITDMGDNDLYNDGNEAKDFGDLQLRKFRSDIVTFSDLTLPTGVNTYAGIPRTISVYPNASSGPVTLSFTATTAEPFTFSVIDMTGKTVGMQNGITTIGSNRIHDDLSKLPRGSYLIRMNFASSSYQEQLLLR